MPTPAHLTEFNTFLEMFLISPEPGNSGYCQAEIKYFTLVIKMTNLGHQLSGVMKCEEPGLLFCLNRTCNDKLACFPSIIRGWLQVGASRASVRALSQQTTCLFTLDFSLLVRSPLVGGRGRDSGPQ